MEFCQKHWDALRAAIKARGLNDFVPQSGDEAAKAIASQFAEEKITAHNFDPLMGAHNAIIGNTFRFLGRIGISPFPMMQAEESDTEKGCPICYLNWCSIEHDKTCDNPLCTKAKGMTFDDWIDTAANEMAEIAKTL
jgi:hypothetical protein